MIKNRIDTSTDSCYSSTYDKKIDDDTCMVILPYFKHDYSFEVADSFRKIKETLNY